MSEDQKTESEKLDRKSEVNDASSSGDTRGGDGKQHGDALGVPPGVFDDPKDPWVPSKGTHGNPLGPSTDPKPAPFEEPPDDPVNPPDKTGGGLGGDAGILD